MTSAGIAIPKRAATLARSVHVAGGIGMQYAGTARLASIVLGIVYLLFSLACIPDILAAPGVYVHYGNFFEQFSCLCGAIALYAATETRAARAVAFGRMARIGIGVCAISFTLSQIFYLSMTAVLVPKWLPPNQTFWAILTTIAAMTRVLSALLNGCGGSTCARCGPGPETSDRSADSVTSLTVLEF